MYWECAETDAWTYTGGITTPILDTMILVYLTASKQAYYYPAQNRIYSIFSFSLCDD